MSRKFNSEAVCDPNIHYMVNIQDRLDKIKEMVDSGAYFTINRARQYGKTTTLTALRKYLQSWYTVIYMDFQLMTRTDFETESSFVRAFADELVSDCCVPLETAKQLEALVSDKEPTATLRKLFRILSNWCASSPKPIVLLIDEVDSATNNQVFLDFLAQMRGYYIQRSTRATFQSVILAGVYDVKNIKRKLRPAEEQKMNSPWNISADFNVAMSFSKADIAGMLQDYESEHQTGMKIEHLAALIYDYTSGYPFLVSRLCKLMDEQVLKLDRYSQRSLVWTEVGFLEAVKLLLSEKNTLFESLIGKIMDYPDLKKAVYSILFGGEKIIYNPDDYSVDMAIMFGFVRNHNGTLAIANRIFETLLYNYFLTTMDVQDNEIGVRELHFGDKTLIEAVV